MDWFLLISTITITYVHVFNQIAKMYFDSDQTMTWVDLYRHFVPPTSFEITL